MMAGPDRWRRIQSPAGDGILFLQADGDVVVAVIPPGQRVPGETAPSTFGWRLGRWAGDPDDAPAIDVDPPIELLHIATADVLAVLPHALHEDVFDLMLAQRRLADALYVPEAGVSIDEAAAEAQAMAITWVRRQLADCYTRDGVVTLPGTADQLLACLPLSGLVPQPPSVPETAEQLLNRIPPPRQRSPHTAEWRTPPVPSTWRLRLLMWLVSRASGGRRTLREVTPPADANLRVADTDRVLLLSR